MYESRQFGERVPHEGLDKVRQGKCTSLIFLCPEERHELKNSGSLSK